MSSWMSLSSPLIETLLYRGWDNRVRVGAYEVGVLVEAPGACNCSEQHEWRLMAMIR